MSCNWFIWSRRALDPAILRKRRQTHINVGLEVFFGNYDLQFFQFAILSTTLVIFLPPTLYKIRAYLRFPKRGKAIKMLIEMLKYVSYYKCVKNCDTKKWDKKQLINLSRFTVRTIYFKYKYNKYFNIILVLFCPLHLKSLHKNEIYF